ncbi:type II secretion system minor pseudopilin GspH [Ferrimonas marina]|uniref:Type II secretion system protein H n=1 Tax=Ferrimonas marina TaxID=299255 RepID=A0A1M5Z8V5_9GAMM|nr:type II secretion system minor pseudopilin GspH [Ferrimonas marina]SHI20631.1 general secretion pathway protein H [Ferrimonas marina]
MLSGAHKASRQRGFTLLELLLVVVLIGVMASAVTLMFSGDVRRDAMLKAGNEFRSVLTMALEESTFTGEQFGVVVEPDHYFFARWNRDEQHWETVNGDPFYRQRKMPEGIEMALELEGLPLSQGDEDRASDFGLDESLFELSEEEKQKHPEPQLFLLPSGEMSGFTLLFESVVTGERTEPVELVADQLGRINWLHEMEEQ